VAELRTELQVGVPNLPGQLRWQLAVDQPAADLCAGYGECIDIGDVEFLQRHADAVLEIVVRQVIPVGLCGCGEAVRDLDTLAGQRTVHFTQ
jgi:hypothetical protein